MFKLLSYFLYLTLIVVSQFGVSNQALCKSSYKIPKNFIKFPADNPYSKQKVLLGKMIFFDPRLSKDGVQSCSSCHNPSLDYQDGLSTAFTSLSNKYKRKTPSLLNIGITNRLFWDGRVESLEELGFGPVDSTVYVHPNINHFFEKIQKINGYKWYFKSAFKDSSITKERIAQALATFLRTIESSRSPFDKYILGSKKSLSKSARLGFRLFKSKARCFKCHRGWNFTDYSFHDIGLEGEDLGRGSFIKLAKLQRSFKTPSLRSVQRRAPYMHNGSLKTLSDVVDFYDRGGDESRDSKSQLIRKLNLKKFEKKALVDFLKSLTGRVKQTTIPQLPL